LDKGPTDSAEGAMTNSSAVSPAVALAYLHARYRVASPHSFVMRIGEYCPEIWELHEALAVKCSAFITAWNPLGALLDAASNGARNTALSRELQRRGQRYFDGVGEDPESIWPGEESFLVAGIERREAIELGNLYQQNAVVWSGSDAVPQLLMLR
jgi:hypothetical protein